MTGGESAHYSMSHLRFMKLHLHFAAGMDKKSDEENKVNVSKKPMGDMWFE